MSSRRNRKVSNLIKRATASCLPHPQAMAVAEDEKQMQMEMEMEMLVEEVFEGVSRMKRAYVRLQEAHCPWEPDKMRVADVAVVAELKHLCVLRERFRSRRRSGSGGGGGLRLTDLVAPYEALLQDLKKEVTVKDFQLHNLKHKLHTAAQTQNNSNTKLRRTPIQAFTAAPSPQLFEAAMLQVREASKSFTSLLLSLMRNAHWDITAAVRSIEAATALATSTSTIVSPQRAKYALQSYISRKIFHGFDHESFYMDGSLSSLLNPDQFRRDCFTQYCNMKSMDPGELLGILPTCHFGKFCSKKYFAIVHPKMEESLFGNLEQHGQVSAGNHPTTHFYNEFLGVAKAVWLLHLLAFSLNPAPTQFEASPGAEFHPQYMESVVKSSGGRVVSFPVSPGFKFGCGHIIKARVYLVGRI